MFIFHFASPPKTERHDLNGISLLYGDCMKLMHKIPDGSIDCVLVDLPYGCLNKGNRSASWDNKLDLDGLWEAWLRVAKPTAPIILFGQGLFSAELITSRPKLYRYTLIWDKVLKNGFLNANRMPLRQHEDLLVFYRQPPVYNPQMVKCDPTRRNHKRGNLTAQKNNCYGSFKALPTQITDEKYPTSIISIAKQHVNGRYYHPTEKPVKLLEWLIKTYSNPGDTILDCCMGSGSTMVACAMTGRKGIGIELMEQYYDTAVKRISDYFQNGRYRSPCITGYYSLRIYSEGRARQIFCTVRR